MRGLIAAASALLCAGPLGAQTPLGTAFTYQGRLTDGGGPASGTYDFQFILYDAATGGSQVGPIVTRDDVAVSGGLFTAGLDFGAIFTGSKRWLEVSVRPGASTGGYTVLGPRQELTPAPNAVFSLATPWTGVSGKPAGFADDIDNDSGGDITGVSAGAGLTGGGATGTVSLAVDPSAVQTRVSATCAPGSSIRTVNEDGSVACEPDDDTPGWGLTGNAGTNPATHFIGTTDGQALEVRVNGLRGLRVEPATSGATGATPNIIGGHPGNTVGGGVAGATIAGGGADLGPAYYNRVDSPAGTIAGGYGNTVSGFLGSVGGGNGNVAAGQQSVVGGGGNSTASGGLSTVGGGGNNEATANFATVGGGALNKATGVIATVPGGYLNVAGGWYSLAAGRRARVRSATEVGGGDTDGDQGTWVWADSTDADFFSTGPNQFLIRAGAGVGINANDPGFPLDVNGVVRSRAGGFRFPDNTTQATAAVNPAADITAVNAGGGLTGGGTSGSVTLAVSFGGSGAAATAARSDHDHAGSYIQNTTAPQAEGNFNISGDGTAGGTLSGNIVGATTQFSLGGARVLSSPGTENFFAGLSAGSASPAGIENSAVGGLAGSALGAGSGNSFFGFAAGASTDNGSHNSLFGSRVGLQNVSGNFNSFFGHRAGESNQQGSLNSFFGTGAGFGNLSGNSNTFLGHDGGNNNFDGWFNTTVGENADVDIGNLTNATAVGSKALVSQSNSLVLGSINGVNGAAADTSVGIGTTFPAARLHVSGPGAVRVRVNSDSNAGLGLALNEQSQWSLVSLPSGFFIVNERLGQNSLFINASAHVASFTGHLAAGSLRISGRIVVDDLGLNGPTALCRNSSHEISLCSSSRRYKTDIEDFGRGLELIDRLRPVSFRWRADYQPDFGLVAEEVAEVEPLLVTRNGSGAIEGVKYDRVAVVLVNAVKEQQEQIARLSRQTRDVYEGVVTTDERGFATLELPESFEASNRDLRYQLTVIGQFARAIVAREIEANRFTIQTDRPQVKVSWQVTSIRKDAFAER